MNGNKLKQEGQKWVDESIITEQQLSQILSRYSKKDPNFIIILFAVLLTGLGFLTFIASDWAQVPHYSRIIVIVGAVVALYLIGDFLFRKRSSLLGISFISLGYIVFGSGMLLTISTFDISLYWAWPFLAWGIIGLLLYAVYEHVFLFILGILVTTAGQIYSGLEFSSFDWLLLLLLLLGFGHYVYHRAYHLFGYLIGISFSLQMIVLAMSENQDYYWLIAYFLGLYIVGELLPKQALRKTLKHISLLSAFIFGMYQTFLLQQDFFIEDVEYQIGFLFSWLFLIGIASWTKYVKKQTLELVDFVLFLPVFYLPFSYVIGLVSLFIFSITWLLIGYRKEDNEKIILGTIAFLFSTFTVYIQYAWDAMNKSLFFLIGGVLLFLISFSLEKQRRSLVGKGDKE